MAGTRACQWFQSGQCWATTFSPVQGNNHTGLDKRSTLALLDAASVGEHPHLENQIDTSSTPALVDGLSWLNTASYP
jgi:hypothetical protein